MEMASAAAAVLSERSGNSQVLPEAPGLGKVSFVAPMLLSRASIGVDGPLMLACAVNLGDGTILLESPAPSVKAGPSTYATCAIQSAGSLYAQPADQAEPRSAVLTLPMPGLAAPQPACSCARVAGPPSGTSSFHVHPAMADAALHIGPLLQTSTSATLIPVAIGNYNSPVSLRGSEQSWATSKVRCFATHTARLPFRRIN